MFRVLVYSEQEASSELRYIHNRGKFRTWGIFRTPAKDLRWKIWQKQSTALIALANYYYFCNTSYPPLYFKNKYHHFFNEVLIITSEVFFLCKIVWGQGIRGLGGAWVLLCRSYRQWIWSNSDIDVLDCNEVTAFSFHES